MKSIGSQAIHRSGKSCARWRCVLRLALLTGLAAGDRVVLAQAPSVDSLNPSVSSFVGQLGLQADGRILMAGGFTTVSNQSHARLARVGSDGSVETAFTASAGDSVYALAVQADGKILLGGDFTSLCGQGRIAVGRLNTSGTLDTSFNCHAFDPPPFTSVIARVQAILLQPDGKIILGGRISYNNGPYAGYVYRLNTNGTTDSSFSSASTSGGVVDSLALQSDGKVLVGGAFSLVNNTPRNRLARLNSDGSLDTGFDAALAPTTDSWVLAIMVQPDQAILLGGQFTTVAGQPRTNLARLYPAGGLDPAFNSAGTGSSGSIYCLALQADGKILVGGLFSMLGGASHSRIGRLYPDGSLDTAFTAGANSDVYALAIQPDGKVLAGGYFTTLAGQPRPYVGRLNNLDPAWQSLSYDGATVTWMRGGSSCEVWRTTFDSSTDGTNWVSLGDGARIPGGWQLANVGLPPGSKVRARGYTTGGAYNSSSWFIETVWPPAAPAIVSTDSLFGVRSNQFGFNITGTSGSTVVVEGSTDFSGWTPLATNVLSSLTLYFCDPDCPAFPHRFYRARLQ